MEAQTEEGLDWVHTNVASKESTLKTDPCQTWYRVWGAGPIHAIFLHGGPGNCVADYGDVNFKILDPSKYTVVEIDQLGTGQSVPSVGTSLSHTPLYRETRCQDIVHALVQVLDELKWNKVFLHGGSWGSGLALLFAQMYPERVSGMVIRGIFTGTSDEMDVIYTKKGAGSNPDMNLAFDQIYEFAKSKGYTGGDSNSKEFVHFFREGMLNGSEAERDLFAWNWWVQEQVAMGDRAFAMNEIQPAQLEEARRVAFWESHVFYEMLWGESAVNLLDVSKLPKVPVFIVQGRGDEVCPPVFAQNLERLLKSNGFDVTAFYVDDGHKVSGTAIREGVRKSAVTFADNFLRQRASETKEETH